MKKSISLTLSEDVLEKLRREAEKEKRSVSQTIEILVEEALEARAKGGK